MALKRTISKAFLSSAALPSVLLKRVTTVASGRYESRLKWRGKRKRHTTSGARASASADEDVNCSSCVSRRSGQEKSAEEVYGTYANTDELSEVASTVSSYDGEIEDESLVDNGSLGTNCVCKDGHSASGCRILSLERNNGYSKLSAQKSRGSLKECKSEPSLRLLQRSHGAVEQSCRGSQPSKLCEYDRPFVTAGASLENASSSAFRSQVVLKRMLCYLEDVKVLWGKMWDMPFGQVSRMCDMVPEHIFHMRIMPERRLSVPWHLSHSFYESVTEFVADVDIREATVGEFADFLRSVLQTDLVTRGCGSTQNLGEDVRNLQVHLLKLFKEYLVELWISTEKIQFACEFGFKSSEPFLCMECHREHD